MLHLRYIKIIAMPLLLLTNIVMATPTAKFTLFVVDEDNVPLAGVDARIGLMKAGFSSGSKSYFVSGKTDENGMFTGSGATEYYATYSANADDYYESGIKFSGFEGFKGMVGLRKWQPWNPTLKIVLKKIKKPIPMNAYNVYKFKIPENNVFIGYDLIQHDWVFPNGKGVTSDLLFKLDLNDIDTWNYSLIFSMKFSNTLDGIQKFFTKKSFGSSLKSAHLAPKNRYIDKLEQSMSMTERVFTSTLEDHDEVNYYFRVRCNDEDPEQCLYGKIYGNIEFSEDSVSFKYYINPERGDRNVEFNPERNLFKGLKATMNDVHEP